MAEQQIRVHNFSNPNVSLKPFAGTEKEDFEQFQRQLKASIALSKIEEPDKVNLLHLHLTDGALLFFDQLVDNEKDTLNHALEALKNRYAGPNKVEIHRLAITSRKFDQSRETAHDLLTDLQRMARLAFPGNDRTDERDRRVKEIFIDAMPPRIRKKLLGTEALTTKTAAEICTRVTNIIQIDQLCKNDEPAIFNEVGAAGACAIPQDAVLSIIREVRKDQDTMRESMHEMMAEMRNLKIAERRQPGPHIDHYQTTQRQNGRYGSKQQMQQPTGRDPRAARDYGSDRRQPQRFDGYCGHCGKRGHKLVDCWHRDSLKDLIKPFPTHTNQKTSYAATQRFNKSF
jgi:hypothetical protein